jgi:hypothetical protein
MNRLLRRVRIRARRSQDGGGVQADGLTLLLEPEAAYRRS